MIARVFAIGFISIAKSLVVKTQAKSSLLLGGRRTAKSNDEVIRELGGAANMSPKGLKERLGTDEAKSVGQSDGGGEP